MPLTHEKLVAALAAGLFPEERYWIDFKRQLYPTLAEGASKLTDGQRRKAHLEFAQDVASMANRGGYLVYGVHENREVMTFEPAEMPLFHGLRETLVSVARDWPTPSLEITPTLTGRPDDPTRGFLVVEVPESREAPHMVDHRYFGRSEVGRILLNEPTVERLILQRRQLPAALLEEMDRTAEHDPGVPAREERPQAYLTAVPTRGWPDMFAPLTGVSGGGGELLNLGSYAENLGGPIPDDGVFNRYLTFVRRGARIRGLWLRDWEEAAPEPGLAGRAVGVGDHGTVRYLALRAAGAAPAPMTHSEAVGGVLYETQLRRHLLVALRFLVALSEQVDYGGAWRLGLECRGLRGMVSERHRRGTRDKSIARIQILDDDQYRETTRADTHEIGEHSSTVLDRLLRPLLRDLGREDVLDQG